MTLNITSALALFFFFASTVNAQYLYKRNRKSNQRIGLLIEAGGSQQGTLHQSLELEGSGVQINDDQTFDSSYDLSLGYLSVYAKDIGLSFKATYSEFTFENDILQSGKMAIGPTIGVTDEFYFVGRLNVNHYFDKDYYDMDYNVGFELGAGIFILENLNLHAGYVRTRNSAVVEVTETRGDVIRNIDQVEANVDLEYFRIGAAIVF